MAKKVSYYTALRRQMGDLIEQLELPDLYKQSLRERWLDQTIWADKKAAQNQKRHYRLRIITIVGGVFLPALVGISLLLGTTNWFTRDWLPWLTLVLSQAIAVSATVEEFCRYGDRWREYRQMAEDLKAEGWQYLQLTGPYQPTEAWGEDLELASLPLNREYELERSTNSPLLGGRSLRTKSAGHRHMEGYAQFAERVESIIKNDVKNYVAGLAQQQAKQEAQVEKILAQAQAVAKDKALLNQMHPGSSTLSPYGGGQPPYPGIPNPGTPGYTAPGYPPVPNDAAPGYSPPPGYGTPPPPASPSSGASPTPAYSAPPVPAAPEPAAPVPPESVPPAASVPTLTPMTAVTLPSTNGSGGIQPFSPGPRATELNAAIVAAAQSLKGMSSASGPDGGRNACAWSVNRVLQKAGIPPLGDNPDYVPSLLEALKAGRGQLVSPQQAKAGDLVIAEGEGHIGIGLDDGCKTVLSNSSSRASFCWESDTHFNPSYGGASTIYRLLR
jgi:hypothetical protein